jgi:hypothetical protein
MKKRVWGETEQQTELNADGNDASVSKDRLL